MSYGEADYGLTEMAFGGQDARFAHDDHLLVRFFREPVKDEVASTREGRPIFTDQDFVSIMVPGDKTSERIKPVDDTIKQRFPKHWAAYQSRVDDLPEVEGTRLSEWPPVSRSMVAELAYFNVHTVEQLAEVADNHAQNVRGIHVLREKARAFLRHAKDQKAAERIEAVEAENAELKERLLALEEKLANPPKRKRRTKAEMEAARAAEAEQAEE